MGDWQPWVEAIRADLREGRLEAATARLAEALAACPDQLWILTTASDVYRAAGEYNTALLYAKQLLRLHPHTYHGYCRGAEDLARLGRREQAHTLIQLGLQRFPAEYWVLVVAGGLHRQAKRPERSLPLAQRLIATFPEKWEGYEWASADLVALKRFEEALATVQQGLERAGQRQELVRLEAYARRFVGERASGHSLEGASRTTLSLRDTIAYAHLPGYFGDLQSLRSKRSGPRGEGVGKNVLFVAGLGRSGTSPSFTTRAG